MLKKIEGLARELVSIDWLAIIERLFRYVQFLGTAALITVMMAILLPPLADKVAWWLALLASVYLIAPAARWSVLRLPQGKTASDLELKLTSAAVTVAAACFLATVAAQGIGLLTRSVKVDAAGIQSDLAKRRAASELFSENCRRLGNPYPNCPPHDPDR
jgi:hypothetical protein